MVKYVYHALSPEDRKAGKPSVTILAEGSSEATAIKKRINSLPPPADRDELRRESTGEKGAAEGERRGD